MIKISSFYEKGCKVLFLLEPTRPARIYEYKLGLAIARKSTDYYVTTDEKIYYSVSSIALDNSIERLKEIQEEAQEQFSQRIQKLRNKLEEFKLLQELTKEKPVKKGG